MGLDSIVLATFLKGLVKGQCLEQGESVVEVFDGGVLARALPRVLKEACVHIKDTGCKPCEVSARSAVT